MNYHVWNANKPRQGQIKPLEYWLDIYKGMPKIVELLQKEKERFSVELKKDILIEFEKTDCKQRPKCKCGNDILIEQEIFRYKTQGGYFNTVYCCLECQSLLQGGYYDFFKI